MTYELPLDRIDPVAIAPKPRRRDREGAGKSEFSWKKHDVVARIVKAQAYTLNHCIGPGGIIIDMHAGDGRGVEQPQMSIFGTNPSRTTSELAVALSHNLRADVVLCEKDKERRAALSKRWPAMSVLRNHRLAAAQISNEHRWTLVINDPNGPRDHGLEHMQAIAERLPIADFIIILNEAALDRCAGVEDERYRAGMAKYEWMNDHREWGIRLGRRQIAVSKLICQSGNFRYRILVAANFLASATKKQPFEKVIQCR